jgi:hypothetical protein
LGAEHEGKKLCDAIRTTSHALVVKMEKKFKGLPETDPGYFARRLAKGAAAPRQKEQKCAPPL